MKPPFRIFNRYQERLAQRLIFTIKHADSGLKDLNLEKDEFFETDREKHPGLHLRPSSKGCGSRPSSTRSST